MIDWCQLLSTVMFITGVSVSIFILLSWFFDVSILDVAKNINWTRLMSKKNISIVQQYLVDSCQKIYRKRMCGSTRCNYFQYYGCKWFTFATKLLLHRHTLILDLDETLVYSCRFSDLSTMVPSLESIGITILRNNRYVSFYVYKRPHLDQFLEHVCDWFDVVVFTAGEKPYADAVLNVIDPRGRITRRLYKEDCSIVDGTYVKPIQSVSSNPMSAIIVDNNPECYRFDKSNAIPISSWYGDAKDRELVRLLSFLDLTRSVEDIRTVLTLDSL